MAATPTTPQALISGASNFTPIAESDVLRWAIIQFNNLNAGLTANTAPTVNEIEAAATQLEMQQSPKMLAAIALQLLIGLIGGSSGTARVLTGSAAPEGVVYAPSGTIYTRVQALGFATTYVKTSASTLSTGWV